MKTCKDCIHENLCVIKAYPDAFENTRWEKEPCDHFKPKTEWISVDERLPEKDGRYLVAMKDGDKYHISTRRFKRTDPPIWWKGHVYGYWAKRTGGVRFWMPLPEPPVMKGR